MKIFGYQKEKIDEWGLLELKEVTFQGSPEILRKAASFLLEMAEAIEKNPGHFDHDHISSVIIDWPDDFPEIVVAE